MPRDKPISKKRKFVKDGIFYAELNDYLAKELYQDGYAGVEVRVTPSSTEVIIRATRTQEVVGVQGRRIRELTALIQKRFRFEPGTVQLFAEKVKNRALSALAQAEAVRYRLFEGLSVRKACSSVVRYIKENGATGCEVVVSGKLRGQRAKSMKFRDGYMIHSGDPVNYYIDRAVKHVHLRQGVLGIKVKIMLPYDPQNIDGGAQKDMPDNVEIEEPKIIEKPIEEDFSKRVQPFGVSVADTQQDAYAPDGVGGDGGTGGGGVPPQFDPYAGVAPQQQPQDYNMGQAPDQQYYQPQQLQPQQMQPQQPEYATPQGPFDPNFAQYQDGQQQQAQYGQIAPQMAQTGPHGQQYDGQYQQQPQPQAQQQDASGQPYPQDQQQPQYQQYQ